jgi:hypothetical protein
MSWLVSSQREPVQRNRDCIPVITGRPPHVWLRAGGLYDENSLTRHLPETVMT